MSIQTAIVAMKTADTTLNTLVGQRFRPDVLAQQETLPAVCFQEISRPRDFSFGIALPTLSHPMVLMKAYAATSAARSALASAIRTAFSKVVSQSAGGITVSGATPTFGEPCA